MPGQHPHPNSGGNGGGNGALIGIVVLLILGVAGYFGYREFFTKKKKEKNDAAEKDSGDGTKEGKGDSSTAAEAQKSPPPAPLPSPVPPPPSCTPSEVKTPDGVCVVPGSSCTPGASSLPNASYQYTSTGACSFDTCVKGYGYEGDKCVQCPSGESGGTSACASTGSTCLPSKLAIQTDICGTSPSKKCIFPTSPNGNGEYVPRNDSDCTLNVVYEGKPALKRSFSLSSPTVLELGSGTKKEKFVCYGGWQNCVDGYWKCKYTPEVYAVNADGRCSVQECRKKDGAETFLSNDVCCSTRDEVAGTDGQCRTPGNTCSVPNAIKDADYKVDQKGNCSFSSCSTGYSKVGDKCLKSCPPDHVRDKNGICRKKNGVCLPESVQKEPNQKEGICYIRLNAKPTSSKCDSIADSYGPQDWFMDGDFGGPQENVTNEKCAERNLSWGPFCETGTNASYKTVSPEAYAYNSETGECEKRGCLQKESWSDHITFVQASDGTCVKKCNAGQVNNGPYECVKPNNPCKPSDKPAPVIEGGSYEYDSEGTCKFQNKCLSPNVLVSGKCVTPCTGKEVRNKAGVCVTPGDGCTPKTGKIIAGADYTVDSEGECTYSSCDPPPKGYCWIRNKNSSEPSCQNWFYNDINYTKIPKQDGKNIGKLIGEVDGGADGDVDTNCNLSGWQSYCGTTGTEVKVGRVDDPSKPNNANIFIPNTARTACVFKGTCAVPGYKNVGTDQTPKCKKVVPSPVTIWSTGNNYAMLTRCNNISSLGCRIKVPISMLLGQEWTLDTFANSFPFVYDNVKFTDWLYYSNEHVNFGGVIVPEGVLLTVKSSNLKTEENKDGLIHDTIRDEYKNNAQKSYGYTWINKYSNPGAWSFTLTFKLVEGYTPGDETEYTSMNLNGTWTNAPKAKRSS